MSDEQWPVLTNAAVRELATTASYERGESYHERGAVRDIVRRGETIKADVQGSQYQPYTATIEFDETGVARTACSCPYNHGGICKHRVAVLLALMSDPDRITERQPVSELIEDTERETLQQLLVDLTDSRPEMAEWVENRLVGRDDETDTDTDGDESVSVNLDSVRRRAQNALPKPRQKGHGDLYAEAERMDEEIDAIVEQARMALDAGNADIALDILAEVANEIASHRLDHVLPYDTPRSFGVFGYLNETFTEALLMVELTADERNEWEDRLTEWDREFEHFAGESLLMAARQVAEEGWDDERVQRAIEGDLDRGGFWPDRRKRWYERKLDAARLSVLERQNRTEEYLNLADATAQTQAYAKMLVHEDRIEEAVAYTNEKATEPEKVLEVTKTLRKRGHPQAALRVAESGLELDGYKKDTLAEWLRDQAASAGKTDLALQAAITAFETNPSMDAYHAVEELAGEEWETIRKDLLDFLRSLEPRGGAATRAAEVFLHEQQYDDAIALANETRRRDVVEPVVDAVVDERSQWAIATCKSRAEPPIENGEYDNYRTAVNWFRKAGIAARSADELDEWREYIETMRDDHDEKYKLRPMLEDLLEEL